MAKTNSQQSLLDKGLITAASNSSISKVKSALDFGANINAQEPECGWTALHFSAYFSAGDKSAEKNCKNLLAGSAAVDVRALDGATPLLTAASVGSLLAVTMLIAAGADVNFGDHSGMTPLMGAADRGDEAIVDALLRAGALAEQVDKRGLSAMDFASKKGIHQIVSLIEASMLRGELTISSRGMVARMG